MAFNGKRLIRAVLAGIGVAAMLLPAACGSSSAAKDAGSTGSGVTQGTVSPGKLTIATGDPAYEPWVMKDRPQSGQGFEAALAYKVAQKLGFSKSDVVWTRSTFDSAIAPGAKDWDMNIQQFSITNERKKAVDFSSSYYNDTQAVTVKKNSPFAKITSLSQLKKAVIGATVGTQGYTYAKDNIKADIQTFNDDASLAQALGSGQIDAMVTSTVESVYIVQSGQVKNAKVVGRLPGSEDRQGMGIVLPKGSKLTPEVKKAVDSLAADGTLKSLQNTWLSEYTTDLAELSK